MTDPSSTSWGAPDATSANPPIPPATQAAPTTPPWSMAASATGADGSAGDPTSSVVVGSEPPKSGGRGRLLAIGAVGALVVAVVGVLAVRSFRGESAGADSPVDAVDSMMRAVQNEDALSMLNLMAPNEVDLLDDTTAEFDDFWKRDGSAYEALKDRGFDFDPSDPIPGFTLTIDNLEYDTEESGKVAKVTVTSLDAEWQFDPEALLEKVDVEQMFDGEVSEDDILDDIEAQDGSFDIDDLQVLDDDPFLMVVEQDGKWFVSPTYTILEYLRVSEDLDEPTFNADTSGGGSDSPEAAVEDMVEALVANDVEEIITLLPPSRYQAFYDYSEPLQQLADEQGLGSGSSDVDIEVDELTALDDDRYELTDVTITFTDPGFSVLTVHIEADCIEWTTVYDDGFEEGDGVCIDNPGSDFEPFDDGIPGIDTTWVVIREEGGKFYVDPFGTFDSLLGAVDTEEFAELVQETANG